jgi:hypothetical protein
MKNVKKSWKFRLIWIKCKDFRADLRFPETKIMYTGINQRSPVVVVVSSTLFLGVMPNYKRLDFKYQRYYVSPPMSSNRSVRKDLLHFMGVLQKAA